MLKTSIQKVFLAKPRGFCAGVARAVKTVEDCLDIFGAPVYVKHEIVHNKTVVKNLEDRGAITVGSAEEIPEHSVVVFSAHGSPPEDYEIARKRGCTIIDATCPLVNKVHLEMHRFMKQGFAVVYIGYKGHQEGIGVTGEALHFYKRSVPVVENVADIEALSFGADEKLAYLTQTTLNVQETELLVRALREKCPDIVAPPAKDICFATTNRQIAVRALAKVSDRILIIGSKHSSNSTRLAEVATASGTPTLLIDSVDDIDFAWFEGATTVGISAGASAPESRTLEVADYFKNLGAIVEEYTIIKEDVVFTEPAKLATIRQSRER